MNINEYSDELKKVIVDDFSSAINVFEHKLSTSDIDKFIAVKYSSEKELREFGGFVRLLNNFHRWVDFDEGRDKDEYILYADYIFIKMAENMEYYNQPNSLKFELHSNFSTILRNMPDVKLSTNLRVCLDKIQEYTDIDSYRFQKNVVNDLLSSHVSYNVAKQFFDILVEDLDMDQLPSSDNMFLIDNGQAGKALLESVMHQFYLMSLDKPHNGTFDSYIGVVWAVNVYLQQNEQTKKELVWKLMTQYETVMDDTKGMPQFNHKLLKLLSHVGNSFYGNEQFSSILARGTALDLLRDPSYWYSVTNPVDTHHELPLPPI